MIVLNYVQVHAQDITLNMIALKHKLRFKIRQNIFHLCIFLKKGDAHKTNKTSLRYQLPNQNTHL